MERGIAKKVVHPKYNFFTYEYDLALVRLESALIFAPHISPICLPATDDLLIGENATVTGWGRLSEGGTLPSILQEVIFSHTQNSLSNTKRRFDPSSDFVQNLKFLVTSRKFLGNVIFTFFFANFM